MTIELFQSRVMEFRFPRLRFNRGFWGFFFFGLGVGGLLIFLIFMYLQASFQDHQSLCGPFVQALVGTGSSRRRWVLDCKRL